MGFYKWLVAGVSHPTFKAVVKNLASMLIGCFMVVYGSIFLLSASDNVLINVLGVPMIVLGCILILYWIYLMDSA